MRNCHWHVEVSQLFSFARYTHLWTMGDPSGHYLLMSIIIQFICHQLVTTYEPGPGSNESCSCGRGPVISALLSSLVFERSGRAVWYGDSDSETPLFHVGGHTYQAPSSLPFSYTVDPVTVVREPCRWLREAIALTIHSPRLYLHSDGSLGGG